ncbi:MAG: 50S ribosomal protein L21 [Elusimicrobiota bacterium]|nr:50S ribosomal protein L21 [Elusimicrobiota bacterium]
MYAIIAIGGNQYKVTEGGKITVNKINKNVGEEIEFTNVLLIKKDGEAITGNPTIPNAKVIGEISKHNRGEKIIVFKKRPKKGYKKKIGHRQYLTELMIKKIVLPEEVK